MHYTTQMMQIRKNERSNSIMKLSPDTQTLQWFILLFKTNWPFSIQNSPFLVKLATNWQQQTNGTLFEIIAANKNKSKMNKTVKTLLIAGGILLGIYLFLIQPVIGSYNGLVQKDEKVKAQWAQVENVYQRRSDLIPNLVNTVKGYANFEKETLTQVIEARSKATQTTIDPTKMTPETLKQFQSNQDGLSSALGRLMVVVEKYPELKANQNFLELQSQLEGTENRITTERRLFNESANDYNTYRRNFPRNIIAGWFGFAEKPYFTAQAGADTAPKVEF